MYPVRQLNHGQGRNLQNALPFDPLNAHLKPKLPMAQTQTLLLGVAAAAALKILAGAAIAGFATVHSSNAFEVTDATAATSSDLASVAEAVATDAAAQQTVQTYARRRGRPKASTTVRRTRRQVAPTRASLRLAAKAPTGFVDMTTQAVQRKALLNSLSSCSADLQKMVVKRDILSRNKLPLSAADLRKLLAAAKVPSAPEAVSAAYDE